MNNPNDFEAVYDQALKDSKTGTIKDIARLCYWSDRNLMAQQGGEAVAGDGKELHDKLIRAIGELLAAKDVPSKWGSVGPDAEDLAWGKVRELVNYVCVRLDSPPSPHRSRRRRHEQTDR